MRRVFQIWFVLMLPVAGAMGEETPEDLHSPGSPGFQAIFFAVIEGAYRDGLTDRDLEVLLTRHEPAAYEYFIYACPLCTPTVAALELYQSRPRRLYSFKPPCSTFGPGIPEEIAELLAQPEAAARLEAIRRLQERWIGAYIESRRLDEAEREALRDWIERAKEEGDRRLRGYREGGSAHLTAPAFAAEGECAVCTGSFEGAGGLPGRGRADESGMGVRRESAEPK
jgi:hypothetical protein